MKIVSFPLTLLAAMLLFSASALATGSISITSVDLPASVTVGDSFTITMSVSGSEVNDVEGSLTLPSGISCTPTGSQEISLSQSGTGSASWSCTGDVAGDYSNQITASVTAKDSGTGGTLSDSQQTGLTVMSPASLTSSSTISPSSVNTGQSATFTVSVHNTGDESTTYSISVSGVSSVTLYSGSSSGTVSGGSVATARYHVSSSSTGTYTVTATITGGNGQTLTETQSLTVTSSGGSNPGGGTTGGNTGGATGGSFVSPGTSQSQEQERTASRKPSLVPGVGLRNNTKLQAAIEKVLGKANMSEQARENLMRLSESITSQVQATRQFRFSNGTSKIENRYKYTGSKKVKNFMIYESVPKDFAQTSDDITVSAPGATIEVVNKDPEYLFTYSELEPGQELVITYEVSSEADESVLDSMKSELYAESIEESPPVQQVCTPGERRCSGNEVQECNSEGTAWSPVEICQDGCLNGACQQAAVPKPSYSSWIIILIIVIIIAITGIVIYVLRSKSNSRPPSVKAINIGKF